MTEPGGDWATVTEIAARYGLSCRKISRILQEAGVRSTRWPGPAREASPGIARLKPGSKQTYQWNLDQLGVLFAAKEGPLTENARRLQKLVSQDYPPAVRDYEGLPPAVLAKTLAFFESDEGTAFLAVWRENRRNIEEDVRVKCGELMDEFKPIPGAIPVAEADRSIWVNMTALGAPYGIDPLSVGKILADHGLKNPSRHEPTPQALSEGSALLTQLDNGKAHILWNREKVFPVVEAAEKDFHARNVAAFRLRAQGYERPDRPDLEQYVDRWNERAEEYLAVTVRPEIRQEVEDRARAFVDHARHE